MLCDLIWVNCDKINRFFITNISHVWQAIGTKMWNTRFLSQKPLLNLFWFCWSPIFCNVFFVRHRCGCFIYPDFDNLYWSAWLLFYRVDHANIGQRSHSFIVHRLLFGFYLCFTCVLSIPRDILHVACRAFMKAT